MKKYFVLISLFLLNVNNAHSMLTDSTSMCPTGAGARTAARTRDPIRYAFPPATPLLSVQEEQVNYGSTIRHEEQPIAVHQEPLEQQEQEENQCQMCCMLTSVGVPLGIFLLAIIVIAIKVNS